MIFKTPFHEIETLNEQRRLENIHILKNYFKISHPQIDSALLFNEQRRGVFTYFKNGNEEVITTIRYPDIIDNIPGYYYDNNMYEFEDVEFKNYSYGKCGQLYYSKKYSDTPIIPAHNITISAVFKNESNEWIEFFCAYYRVQGVDNFMLHYNGKLEERQGLPQAEDITYIEWDFPRIIATGPSGGWNRNEHFQVGLFPVTVKKYIPNSKHTLAIDIDELFFVTENTTLAEYLNNIQFNSKLTGLRVGCRWSVVDFDRLTVDIKDVKLERHKIIYTNNYTHPYIRLHCPCVSSIVDDFNLNLMHVTNVPFTGELYYPATNTMRYKDYTTLKTYKKVKIKI